MITPASAGPSVGRAPQLAPVADDGPALIDRRSWLMATGTLLVGAAARRSGATGQSDRIRVGAIGVGNRGRLLLEQLPPDAELVAICDCNLPQARSFKKQKGGGWKVYQDYRELLDRNDIDAVIIATGDFQRALPCIHACQAGKDVYAEKPLTLTVAEGRAVVDAARRHGRVFQVGTQQRSMTINRLACEFVRNGGLGTLREVRAINYKGPKDSPEPFPSAETVPPGLDWNAWLNQAAERPYAGSWMNWMQWRDFAGGEMTNWGAHGVDQIQWALGADETGPVHLAPLADAPSGSLLARYPSGVEVKFMLEQGPMGGAVFIGDKGKLEINRNKVTSNPPEIAADILAHVDVAAEEIAWSDQTALWQAQQHLQNWLDCIRSRARPVADVEIGHRSISVCHLANIVRRLGRPLDWDPVTERFVSDADADGLLSRPRRAGFELPEA
jgi:predicted dehydrogenase